MERTLGLIQRAHDGDKEARDILVEENVGLVWSVARHYSGRGHELEDLFQIGCIGLIKAIDNFDISQNVKFSTYAVPMIIGEIRRYLRDNNSVRVSRSLKDTAYKALTLKEQFINEHGREPKIEEIAKLIGLPKEDVVYAIDAIQEPVSLFEPVYNDGNGDAIFVMDQVKDDKSADDLWLNEIALKEAIKRLNDREKHILTLRFYQGKTQTEVAEEIGISQAQVSRLEKSALSHMRKYI